MSTSATSPRVLLVIIVAAAVLAAAAATWFLRRDRLPQPGTEAYEQVTGAFYRGLAALDVGLLDDARREFTTVTEQVPEEPAAWANLGLARVRLGELDEAVEPVQRARSLAPDNPEIELLAGRVEIARGRLDEGLAYLRRVVELEPRDVQARFALAEEVERAAGPGADQEAAALLAEIAEILPDNVAIHVERARLAARMQDAATLGTAVARLEALSTAWPERVVEQLNALQEAVAAGDFQRAQLATTFLRNVLTSVPAFVEDLLEVRTPTELIAQPLDRFVVLAPPRSTPAPADRSVSFAVEPIGSAEDVLPVVMAAARPGAGEPQLFATDGAVVASLDGPDLRVPFPLGAAPAPSLNALLPLDWNNDFRMDLVLAGGGGVRLLLRQEDGTLIDRTPQGDPGAACNCFGAWAADVEMDGDLDIVAAPSSGGPIVLRNNGNESWTPAQMFPGVTDVRGFAWADLDLDGDPDALFLDARLRVHAFRNRQAGDFVRLDEFPEVAAAVAVTVADIDADGVFDVITLDEDGVLRKTSAPRWESAEIATWEPRQTLPGTHRLIVADLDNNGALDLLASGNADTRIWLAGEDGRLETLDAAPAGVVFDAFDQNGDGRLDLLASIPAGGAPPAGAAEAVTFQPGRRPARAINRGTAAYHWKVIRPRAQTTAGDQRINSFGVGGDIEVRSGLLVQKHLLTGGPVHVGLGDRTAIDVARIVWPNGVAQAEFGEGVDDELVAEQRLKGSCPWVFAWDGQRMSFVTDFLWRSPLGLRINAQDTAGVTQTEDWVRIRGDQLAPRDGKYDLRITAELWETHFFDHVSLMVVDHPAGSDVFVDERFSPAAPPRLAVHAVRGKRAVARAWDHRGGDATTLVAERDGQYLARFEKGPYQGIAHEHFVELELSDDVSAGAGGVLLANGWIYPTDSSINVAIGQGGDIVPSGLALEALGADGQWRVVTADLGFPAGKHKTIVIDLTPAAGARRLRLRTNLEIAWDAIEYAVATDVTLRTTRLPLAGAELRYRGFSETSSPRAEQPETPHYDRIATRSQRWRDLEGYHTRFGDVRELLEAVDDRYVIMNAGDEMRLLFDEQPAAADGWQRDFVLIGDGWEKDGDYNTGFSQTVLPLPSHDKADYGSGVTSLELEDDPVYQRHAGDWQRYHTRYVTPRAFIQGLRGVKASGLATPE